MYDNILLKCIIPSILIIRYKIHYLKIKIFSLNNNLIIFNLLRLINKNNS